MNLTREFKEKCRVSPKPVKWFYFYVKYLLLLQSFSNTVLVVLYLMVIKDAINDPTISIPLYISMVGTLDLYCCGSTNRAKSDDKDEEKRNSMESCLYDRKYYPQFSHNSRHP